MNSKNEFIEYFKTKLETIKQSKSRVYAELGICPAYGHADCLIIAQGKKSNLLGVAYASVDEGKISGLSLCIVPTPDLAERSRIYPWFQANWIIQKYFLRTFISFGNISNRL